MFYCIFKKEFSKCGVLGPRNFFEKFLKIFKQKMCIFFKIEKIIIFVLKLVQNHHIDIKFGQFFS